MFAVIGALLFLGIAVMTALVACVFPLGEFTMGGQYKILPNKFRIMAIVSVAIQLFAMLIVFTGWRIYSSIIFFNITKYICFFFAAYLSLNTIMNLASKSKKEKYVMTPLSFIAAICYWITTFQM